MEYWSSLNILGMHDYWNFQHCSQLKLNSYHQHPISKKIPIYSLKFKGKFTKPAITELIYLVIDLIVISTRDVESWMIRFTIYYKRTYSNKKVDGYMQIHK